MLHHLTCVAPGGILLSGLKTMKRVERHLVKGPLYKHFDLERKTAKQAEAILGQRLQRLEEICLYHVKLLTREQRQLQRELQRLQQGKAFSTGVAATDCRSSVRWRAPCLFSSQAFPEPGRAGMQGLLVAIGVLSFPTCRLASLALICLLAPSLLKFSATVVF